jgi:hypothetical protein
MWFLAITPAGAIAALQPAFAIRRNHRAPQKFWRAEFIPLRANECKPTLKHMRLGKRNKFRAPLVAVVPRRALWRASAR